MFLNRGGSPVAAEDVKLSGSELSFMIGGTGAEPADRHAACRAARP